MPNPNVGLLAVFVIGFFPLNAHSLTHCYAELVSYNHTIENCVDGETLTFGGTTYQTCFECSNGNPYAVKFSDSQCSNTATKYLCPTYCEETEVQSDGSLTIDGCSWEDIIKFGNKQYRTCYMCSFGYRGTSTTLTNEACSNSTTVTECEEIPAEEAECYDDGDCGGVIETSVDGTRLKIGAEGYCDSYLTCSYNYEYWVCATGYYGDGETTCTKCPELDGVHGETTSYGATSVSSCYIPANTNLNDAFGTYKFSSNCYASN